MLSYREMMAECMWHKLEHDWAHGYSQIERSTNYDDREEIELSDGTHVWIAAWDDDCSGSIRDNIIAVGLDPNCFTYTGNEAEGLLNSGQWVEIGLYDADNGDVVLREGHTEQVLRGSDGELYQGGFRISELGTIYGETGDQTGWEATYSSYQPWAWEQCFRCIAERNAAPSPEPAKPLPQQGASEPLNGYGLAYRAHCEDVGWCDPVRDGQTAGTVGYGARLEAIKCTPPSGIALDFMLHVQDVGDVWYRGVKRGVNDPEMGTVGEGKRVEGIQVNVTERDGDMLGKTVYYRCHIQDIGWTSWMREGDFCGTRNEGMRVEAIQIMLVAEQDHSEPKNHNGLKYRVHTQDYGWLPTVHDGMVAGTTGQSRRIEAIQFVEIPEGLELDVHAHIENKGDIAYDNISRGNAGSVVIGTVGKGLRLEGINIHVLENKTGMRLMYEAHVQDLGWTGEKSAGQPCGTSGQGKRMEAIKFWLE